MEDRIYLDNNATTPLDPRVLEAMFAELRVDCGNPSSVHHFGQRAKHLLDQARGAVAKFFACDPRDLVFTSGATESINMVMRGLFEPHYKGHIITSDCEHPAVHATAKTLCEYGCEASFLPCGKLGAVSKEAVEAAIRPDTKLVALMAVNNETGVRTDIEGIAALCEARRIPFLVDGTAWVGKEVIRLPKGVSAFCCSGHKIHAPKGIGLAIIRNLPLRPLLTGGSHQYKRRAGTEPLAGILAFAKALSLITPETIAQMKQLRERFEEGLLAALPCRINGEGPRTANTSNICFPSLSGESLLMTLDMAGLACSHGSACSSGALEPSRVLLNMGYGRDEALSSVRFSVGRFTTAAEIERAINIITERCQKLRR